MNKLLFSLMTIKSEDDFLKINIQNSLYSNINDTTDYTFQNTIFLWSIFNCKNITLYYMLKHKNKIKLDINKYSGYDQKLSPLQALILKGSNRCGLYNNINLLDLLLDQKDIDMYYINDYGLDAMSIALLFYDFEVVDKLQNHGFILKNTHKSILSLYYKHNITPDSLLF